VVKSGKNATEVEPNFDAMGKLPGRPRAISVSGIAPPESGFDFYGRLFAPSIGCNEVKALTKIMCSKDIF